MAGERRISAWLRGRGALAEAFFIRFVVIAYALWFSTRLWKPPTRPGATRWLVWCSAWALGAGYFMSSVDIDHYKGWLHISFICGFALMTLSVSTQLVLGHGGYEKQKDGYPLPVLAMGAALLAATGPRILMEINQNQFYVWIALASACFLFALCLWLGFVGSKLVSVVIKKPTAD